MSVGSNYGEGMKDGVGQRVLLPRSAITFVPVIMC